VRSQGDPAALAGDLRTIVGALDPEVPVASVRTMNELLADSVARSRFNALLLAIFGIVALLIAVVGVYGVVAYMVAQRTQEIGIRMALGAARADVVRMVVRGGMLPTLAGVALGLVAALGLAPLLSSLLFRGSGAHPAQSR